MGASIAWCLLESREWPLRGYSFAFWQGSARGRFRPTVEGFTCAHYSMCSSMEAPSFAITFSLLAFAHFRNRWQVGPEKMGFSVASQFS